MDLSLSSKHLLFLSLQRHHIRQRGTIIHIWMFQWRPNRPCQQARSSTIDFGITQLTPNKPKTIDHKSMATDNEGKDGQLIHLYTYMYNTNPISKPSFFLYYQSSNIPPKLQSKQRKPLERGSFASICFSKENINHLLRV